VKAFLEAQREFPVVPRKGRGQVGSRSYRYATLDDLLVAVEPVLHTHGLAVSQALQVDGDRQLLVTKIVDAEGALVLGASVRVPDCDDPHRLGAWLTYLRRYSLASLLGVATEEDIDGEADARRSEPAQRQEGRPATSRQLGAIGARARELGLSHEEVVAMATEIAGRPVGDPDELTTVEASRLLDRLG
jgi:hypothetical protein